MWTCGQDVLASALLPQPSKTNMGTANTAPANKLQAHLSEDVFCWTMFRATASPEFIIFFNMELNDDSLKNCKGNKRVTGNYLQCL